MRMVLLQMVWGGLACELSLCKRPSALDLEVSDGCPLPGELAS
jgi:hypothetical protein